MKTIVAQNVNSAYAEGLWWLKRDGKVEESRNGKVIVYPTPVTTIYKMPEERVLFDKRRRANPFFHLAECVWMLAGSCDLAWIQQFNSNMASFSDDGKTLNGAYGYRLRSERSHDQLLQAVQMLSTNKKDRRVVLTMWNPQSDLGSSSRDVPCNTQIYLCVRNGCLDMMVTCRSNDVIWGAYGANAVHFSFIQEWLAWAIGVSIGELYQVSWNYHIYKHHWHLLNGLPRINSENPYGLTGIEPIYLSDGVDGPNNFLRECEFLTMYELGKYTPKDVFLQNVFLPMALAWKHRADKMLLWNFINSMPRCDWKVAAKQYFLEKETAHE